MSFAQIPITEQAFGAAGQLLPQIMFVAGIVVLGFFITMSIRAKIRRRQANEPSSRERVEQIKAARQNRDDIQASESHALEFTQRLAAQLDAKAARLEQLIRDADERIAALSAMPSSSTTATVASRPPAAPPRSVGPSMPQAHPVPAAVDQLDVVTQSIYELADAGRDSLEIARQLDEQIGKVELILALRQL